MKKLKGILSVGLCLSLMFVFTSCGNPYSGVDFDEYIEVADYTGLTVTPISVTVTDEEVEAQIQSNLEEHATTEDVTTGVVEDGDTINIDYVGSIDGVKFDGGSESGVDLVIGSGTMIDGFESGLIGAKVGSTVNIKVTFPDTYSNTELAGKNAVFAVTINSMEVTTVPELTDEFVKEYSGDEDVTTVAEYKEMIKNELLEEKTAEAEEEQRTTVWDEVVSNSKMKTNDDGEELYPEKQLQEMIDENTEIYESLAEQSDMTLSDFVSTYFGMDEDTFNTQVEELSKVMVKEQMVLYYIADKQDIKVTRSDYKSYITDTLAMYGYTEKSYKEANNGKSYEKVVGKKAIKEAALKELVEQYIVDNGKES